MLRGGWKQIKMQIKVHVDGKSDLKNLQHFHDTSKSKFPVYNKPSSMLTAIATQLSFSVN